MAKSPVTCTNCGGSFLKENREINRAVKKGLLQHFCTLNCAAISRNAPIKAQEIVLTCACGVKFHTTTKVKGAKHCSRGCASRYSMNEDRREAQRQSGLTFSRNLIPPSEALKLREQWKYVALEAELQGRPYEFEHALGGYVFDLALFDTKVLVEFDGPYHECSDQRGTDSEKDRVAEAAGFLVVRRAVQSATIIAPGTIRDL